MHKNELAAPASDDLASHTCLMQVFLDEINTSSCMGLLKEVLVDRTFFGQVGVLQTGAL